MVDFILPDNTQRTTIIGRTGSGKTYKGNWLLSHSDFLSQPWVIIDFKYDELINSIPHTHTIGLNELPKKPGIYITHPEPEDEEKLERFCRGIWAKENIGVYIDEASMMPKNSKSYNSLMTQGRSKHIPVINLTQRPAWVSRYVLSEADFLSVFQLTDRDDQLKVERFVPTDIDERLPDYHSRWYDVKQNATMLLKPVPGRDSILERFETRLKPPPRFYI